MRELCPLHAGNQLPTWASRVDAAYRPTLARPFIFSHLRKTGGTTLDALLTKYAFPGLQRTIIPCHSVGCAFHDLLGRNLNRTACALVFTGGVPLLPLLTLLLRVDRGEFGPVCCSRWTSVLPAVGSDARLSADVADGLAWQLLDRRLPTVVTLVRHTNGW